MADVPEVIPWDALVHFVFNLPADSAVLKRLNADVWQWSQEIKTNAILADVVDALNIINYSIIKTIPKSRPKKPKPYPRPSDKNKQKKIGKEPIKISEFDDWWNGKGKEVTENA